ncbi:hypothetical protein FBY14_102363 [Azospirillum brasilense]|nr:hypothetical protein FBY14_102363 [Azospirillum brasilense]
MGRIGWVTALATVAGWSFPALAWDTLTTDGAVACESLYQVKEADKAAQAGDDAWLKSLGCARVPGGLSATMIERPRNATNYRAQLRLHDANATVWIGAWDIIPVTAGPPEGEGLKDPKIVEALQKRLARCSSGVVQSPGKGAPLSFVVYVSRGFGGAASVNQGDETIVFREDLLKDESVRAMAHRAYKAVDQHKCHTYSDAVVGKALKDRNLGVYVEVPVSVP